MAIVLIIAAAALIHKVGSFMKAGNYLLVAVGVLLLVLQLWIVVEGTITIHHLQHKHKQIPTK